MTTQEFIKKTYNVPSSKRRSCSSVFTDQNGTVYSYGYHFPLVFQLKGYDFVNTASYSSTTGKHQAWAKSALNYSFLNVELDREAARTIANSWADDQAKLQHVERCLRYSISQLQGQMDAKKRKDTAVYADLALQVHHWSNVLQMVTA